MRFCDLTFRTPAENLACDEVLLDLCEGGSADELIRFWEPAQYFVVVGYGNKLATEVHVSFCREQRIPILRRCTGGGTVLQGPGCLNYSLILRSDAATPLHNIRAANEFIMQRQQAALGQILQAHIQVQGHTDLAIGGLKFSGNAQRRKKRYLLFHGTFLLRFDIALLEKVLPLPSKQPGYRGSRSHRDFLMNLKISSSQIKGALLRSWNVTGSFGQIPFEAITTLAQQKYGHAEWNERF